MNLGRPVSSAYLVWMPIVLAVFLILLSGGWKVVRLIAGDSAPADGEQGQVLVSGDERVHSSPHPSKSPGKPPINKHPAQVKLERIIIPVIDFDDTTVEEAVDFLRLRVRELDRNEAAPEKTGIGIVVRKPRFEGLAPTVDEELDAEGGLEAEDPGTTRISLQAKNISAWEALHRVAEQANLNFHITDHGLAFTPAENAP